MFFLATICCLGVLASSAPHTGFYDIENAEHYFEEFLQKYGQQYDSEAEKQARFEIFKTNLDSINMKNKIHNTSAHAITKFSDMTPEEFKAKYTGYGQPFGAEIQCTPKLPVNRTGLGAPASFDWRQQDKVTRVKNQMACQSCWAFSSTGTMEGQYAIKYNQLVEFSEQQLVDCQGHQGGCSRGDWMTNAILATVRYGGVMSEQDYPYTGSSSECRGDPSRVTARVTGCREFTFGRDEEALKQTLVEVGPLAIAIDSSSLLHYGGGVWQHCTSQQIDHAVLLVGYNAADAQPHWIIKNSWGENWGEAGYLKIPMNTNACAMMDGQFVTAVIG